MDIGEGRIHFPARFRWPWHAHGYDGGGNAKVVAELGGTQSPSSAASRPARGFAVYKACWQAPDAPSASCLFSDSAAATEQAILDGVDILSFSVGTSYSFTDPQDFAFLLADGRGHFRRRARPETKVRALKRPLRASLG